jgi:hypothetical protein
MKRVGVGPVDLEHERFVIREPLLCRDPSRPSTATAQNSLFCVVMFSFTAFLKVVESIHGICSFLPAMSSATVMICKRGNLP